MRVRRLTSSGDYSFGGGLADYLADSAEAVAQRVRTRLDLWLGQWFADLNAGTPWETEILGKYTGGSRDLVLRAAILDTDGVRSLISYSSRLDRTTRVLTVAARLDTIYGEASVTTTGAT